jgi:hypothetical protein
MIMASPTDDIGDQRTPVTTTFEPEDSGPTGVTHEDDTSDSS